MNNFNKNIDRYITGYGKKTTILPERALTTKASIKHVKCKRDEKRQIKKLPLEIYIFQSLDELLFLLRAETPLVCPPCFHQKKRIPERKMSMKYGVIEPDSANIPYLHPSIFAVLFVIGFSFHYRLKNLRYLIHCSDSIIQRNIPFRV